MGDLKYGLAYKTELSLKEIEGWMRTACAGKWDVRLADLDEDDPTHIKKKLEVFFELAKDKENFKLKFSQRK